MVSHLPNNNAMTCRKCNVNFLTLEETKTHYGSPWHNHNLVLSMQGHPILSEEQHHALVNKQTFLLKGFQETFRHECKVCEKSFQTQGSYDTHMRSKKHKAGLLKQKAEKYRVMQTEKKANAAEQKKLKVKEASSEDKTAMECDFCPGKSSKTAVFTCEKDYARHIETQSHKDRVKAREMEDERRKRLEEMDAEGAVEEMGNMALEEGTEMDENPDDWEDVEGEEGEAMDDGDEDGDDAAIPPETCFLCGKKFRSTELSLAHMERSHNFFLPHKKAAKLTDLLEYIGHKVGVEHKCMDCSRPFRTLKGAQTHMLAKPHYEIRFEGEYDPYFDLEKILAPYGPIPRVASSFDGQFLCLPDGNLLTHRDLRQYFKQRVPMQTALKRLKGAGSALKSITHLGKAKEGASLVEIRKTQKLETKRLHRSRQAQFKQQIGTSVRANKLQHHFRPQVINAG